MDPIAPITKLSSSCANSIAKTLAWIWPSKARAFCFWHRVQCLQHPSWVGPITWKTTATIPLNLKMRVPVAEQQGMRLALGDAYESELTDRIIDYLKPGDVFIDVGANMGYFSLLGSKLVGPAGQVLAFEPLLANFAWLAHNLQLNGADNVLAFSSALSNQSGIARISVPPFFNNGISSLRDASNGHPTVSVQLQQFDEIPDSVVVREKIHLIKIDTEGHELNVLHGMQKTLQRAQPMAVACELTPAWTSVGSIVELLSDAGFRGEYFQHGEWRPITDSTEFPEQCNAWFAKNARVAA